MTYRKWTRIEEAFLVQNTDMPTAEASRALGRTYKTIKAKRDKLNLPHVLLSNPAQQPVIDSKTGPGRRWTEADDSFLVSNTAAPADVLARHLDRTPGAIESRRRLLSLPSPRSTASEKLAWQAAKYETMLEALGVNDFAFAYGHPTGT